MLGLIGQIGVGNEGPGHGHGVRVPPVKDLLSLIRRHNAAHRHHREVGGLFDGGGIVGDEPVGLIGRGVDDGGRPGVGVHRRADVDHVHIGPGHLDELHRIGQAVAPLDVLGGADGEHDDHVRPHRLPDPGQHLQREAAAVADRAAVLVLPGVGAGREKLVQQPAVPRLNVDNIKSGQLGHGRRLGVAVQRVGHKLAVHGLDGLAILAEIVYRPDRIWARNIFRVGHAARVVQLHRDRRTVFMDGPDHLGQRRQHAGVVQHRVPVGGHSVPAVHRRIPDAHHRRPAPGLFRKGADGVVSVVAVAVQIAGLDGGGKQPVLQP